MTTDLENWERQHLAEAGNDPFLFYVVYGNVDWTLPVSNGTYRTTGEPDGIEMLSYGPNCHPDVPHSFCEGYLWEDLTNNNLKLTEIINQEKHCTIIQGTPTDNSTLNFLRDVVGLITFSLEHGGCAVYDPQMFQWWSPEKWREKIFEPNAPVPRHHTVILISDEENKPLKWFHTRGMRKFGRPDISVHNVPIEHQDAVIELCNQLIEQQAFGHCVPEGQEVRLDTLPSGGVINHRGNCDDPEFNNVHIEVNLFN